MSYLFIKVNGKSYVFRRYVTESQMELFKTHRAANSYYFKVTNNKSCIKFYVRNNSSY